MEQIELKEKENVGREIIYGFFNIFSHYLYSIGEKMTDLNFSTMKPADFISAAVKTIETLPPLSSEDKEKARTMLLNLEKLPTISYWDIATVLDLGNINGLFTGIRKKTFEELQNKPEAVKEYIKSLM